MAAQITTWEQTALFEPGNPNQRTHVRYTGVPGGYGSFYFNRVPTTAKLQGIFDTLPDWATIGIIGLLGLGVGFFGAKTFGPSIRRKLARR